MDNGIIRTGNPRGFNKGRSLKFCVGSKVQQIPEEGWRTYRPKCCGNNKDEDKSLKILNDKNQQALSQKFRQLLFSKLLFNMSHLQTILMILVLLFLFLDYSCQIKDRKKKGGAYSINFKVRVQNKMCLDNFLQERLFNNQAAHQNSFEEFINSRTPCHQNRLVYYW